MKRTPWYPGSVKPVRNGHYETRTSKYSVTAWLDTWDGKEWRDEDGIPINQSAVYQWRGLAEKPKC